MKKIVAPLIIIAGLGLAGCNEEKPTKPTTTKPTPMTEQEIKDANNKLMYIAPRELPTPPPPINKSGQ